jgi:hypothetical protein
LLVALPANAAFFAIAATRKTDVEHRFHDGVLVAAANEIAAVG